MNSHTKTQGSCLCGTVKFSIGQISKAMGACHCNMCRKWVGGPFFAVNCGTDILFENSATIKTYTSSNWAERGFCTNCGTSLFYKLKPTGQYMMPAGVLDIEPTLNFTHQIFIDEKPNYYCFSNKTKNMTGAEVFEQFAKDNG